MNYLTDKAIQNRVKEHLDYFIKCYPEKDWFIVAAQGSINYGIVDNESDVDTKLLTLPSLKELVLNTKPFNKVLEMPINLEHVDCKDAREYFKIFRKSNINFVEILFSDYWIANPLYIDLWLDMRAKAEDLARMNPYAAVGCMRGMAGEKLHALCHEYPSRMPWIEKYGYDPKQLSHLARIAYFIHNYVEGSPYKDCIYPREEVVRTKLLACKRNGEGRSLDEAKKYAEDLFNEISDVANLYRETVTNENDPECDKFLDDILYKLITRSITMQLHKGE